MHGLCRHTIVSLHYKFADDGYNYKLADDCMGCADRHTLPSLHYTLADDCVGCADRHMLPSLHYKLADDGYKLADDYMVVQTDTHYLICTTNLLLTAWVKLTDTH